MFGKGYNKKVPYQTPQQKAIEKRKAAKHGKATASLLSKHPAYKSNDEKIASDPSIQEFLKQVS